MSPLPTLRGALLQPKQLFGSLTPGPVGPALLLTALFLFPPALAATLTDHELWSGHALQAVGRGIGWWLAGVLWLMGPQAALFALVMRVFGARAPLSLAQRGMAAFSALLCVFGTVMSIAGINPDAAAFVISWYATLVLLTTLGTFALFRFATGAYGLSAGKAMGAVLVFEVLHGIALVIALGVFFTVAGVETEHM